MKCRIPSWHYAVLSTGILFLSFLSTVSHAGRTAPVLRMEVNATEISRLLLHSRVEIPCEDGSLTVWYPKWIPGVHAPGGPVQNLGGLFFESPKGERLDWRRDQEELYRFECDLPGGATRAVVLIDYICNQPSVNSVGVDSYGNPLIGIINWNTCLVYPEGPKNTEIHVDLRVKIPEGWRFGTALPVEKREDGWIQFKTATLQEVIDSPLICGEHFRTIELAVEEFPPHFLHLVSESPTAIEIEDEFIEKFRLLVQEAKALFGVSHYPEYHFLVVLSDRLRNMGLEHLASSLNGVGERAFIEEKDRKGWTAYLLPHEFVHSWCGKYRRPAAMCTNDYHTTKKTELLWVYEGLTQYLGEVLTVRSGFLTLEEYRDRFTQKLGNLMRQKGREWRSLSDTAVSGYLLRGGSPHWSPLTRGQDYYSEGLLFWLEVDSIIRRETDGRKNLDDFCAKFFGRSESEGDVVPYGGQDVLDALNEVFPYNWENLIEERIRRPMENLSLDFVGFAGYRLAYDAEPSKYQKEHQKDGKFIAASDSLGLDFHEDGRISYIVPDTIADRAGLAPEMKVMGVNGRKFSRQRIEDALADSVSKRKVELLVLEGDCIRTITLDYADGPKYLKMVQDGKKRDLLSDILSPRTYEKEEKQ